MYDIIKANEDKIIDALKDAYRETLTHPDWECRVYIDSDGDVGREDYQAGDDSWLEFDDEDYVRYYLDTINNQYYDAVWDCWFSGESWDITLDQIAEEFDLDRDAVEETINGDDRPCKDDALVHCLVELGVDPDAAAAWMASEREKAIDDLVGEFNEQAYDIYSAFLAQFEGGR